MEKKRLKDLPGDTDISHVPVWIPEDIYKDRIFSCPPSRMVYVRSIWSRGVWVVEKIEDTRTYPITEIYPESVLEWEIDESYEQNGNFVK